MGFCRIDVCFVCAYLGGEEFHLEGQGLCRAFVPWYGCMRVVNGSENGGSRYLLCFRVVASIGGKDEGRFVVVEEKVYVV